VPVLLLGSSDDGEKDMGNTGILQNCFASLGSGPGGEDIIDQ